MEGHSSSVGPVTTLQRLTAMAIVNIFETGSAMGEYGTVTSKADDPGHLTYGRSQTSLTSGSLHKMIEEYCGAEGARHAAQLRNYLERLQIKDVSLDNDLALHDILRKAGSDPIMKRVQDSFFERSYWHPAATACRQNGITTPLGHAVVYDSFIHSGRLRNKEDTDKAVGGTAQSVGEKRWLAQYVAVRRDWLAHSTNTLVQKTVYRMDAFKELIDAGNWDLNLPVVVRRVRIDEHVLGHSATTTPSPASTTPTTSTTITRRLLQLADPLMRGDDVEAVQDALNRAGFPVGTADGFFGQKTKEAVVAFQKAKRLDADGRVGKLTYTALGL